MFDALEALVDERVAHDEGTPLLILELLLHQVHGWCLFLVFLLVLLLCGGVILLGRLDWCVELLQALQVIQHRIDSRHHVLRAMSELILLCVVSRVLRLLSALHASRTARHILCVLLSRQPLQGLIQILKLLVLLLPQL